MYMFIHADEPSEDLVKNKSNIALPSSMVFTPQQASSEFANLLINIVEELSKNESKNLRMIKFICS